MSEEEKLRLLWGIATTLTETDTTYETGMGGTECVFCSGDPGYGLIAFKHQDNCPVTIATKLMREKE